MTYRENIQTLMFWKLLKYTQNQCSNINKQCSLNLDVAYYVYLDIPNMLKPQFVVLEYKL